MSKFDINTANLLSACDARKAIDEGLLSSQELVEACFARIDALEDSIGAWTHLDKEIAMQQACEADEFRSRGVRVGALHGLPIGIKDIIDTRDYATELGTALHKGRRPSSDATLVSLLKEAGAIILGKTVTTELAVFSPGKTTNPHNNEHTPGGSSSGSAAAVASAMVPLAVGTQTNGSVIRPASFCGIYGFKPSFGRISRHGILKQSPPLDTVGVFARCLEDLALIADVVMRYDAQDDAMLPIAPPCISAVMVEPVPVDPVFAFVRTPAWGKTEQVTKDGFRELIETVNESKAKTIDIFDLPAQFNNIFEDHRKVMEADLAQNFAEEYARGRAELSEVLCSMIERGQQVTEEEYNASIATIADYASSLDEIFELYDAILTPATPGPAPKGLHATGDPVMNTIWTFCGTPALNLPLLQSKEGLPFGVQLVGEKGDDARLFRSARWLLDSLNDL
ncbi:MAG: Asp-tRNA(Asn)/Glu-tRNA(Gln) amidotransferase A subunit family amidase [Gammaproteobacteria bacterium]|jgi:Asp-tRNA(Asn)/Glu-tRNA(Gln) amidotransferase A subunit family amidase